MEAAQVHTIDPAADPRQIGGRRRSSAAWNDRRDEVQAAVAEVVDVVVGALDKVPVETGWRASKVEAAFGVTLLENGGVLLSGKGDESALQIQVTFERPAPHAEVAPSADG